MKSICWPCLVDSWNGLTFIEREFSSLICHDSDLHIWSVHISYLWKIFPHLSTVLLHLHVLNLYFAACFSVKVVWVLCLSLSFFIYFSCSTCQWNGLFWTSQEQRPSKTPDHPLQDTWWVTYPSIQHRTLTNTCNQCSSVYWAMRSPTHSLGHCSVKTICETRVNIYKKWKSFRLHVIMTCLGDLFVEYKVWKLCRFPLPVFARYTDQKNPYGPYVVSTFCGLP